MKNLSAIIVIAGLFVAAGALGQPGQGGAIKLDTLIVNGMVYDGSDSAAQSVAIGVKGDRIVFVGDPEAQLLDVETTIDAGGLLVVPGFIDPHTHSLADLLSPRKSANLNYLTQGVTTVFVGNDGDGSPHIGLLASELEKGGFGTNVALFVGHGAIRSEVMGKQNRSPTPEELAAMKGLVSAAMEQGALGLSAGLYYTPGNYASTDEVVALARIAAEYGGVYESHLRDESSYSIGFLAALEEALEIGRRAQIPVHVGHIKALGVDVWGDSEPAIAMIEKAREQGQVVTADQYPWEASGTHMRNALMPRWALADSEERYQSRLRDPDLAEEISTAVAENIRRRGGADALLIATCPDERFIGKTLSEAATILQANPTQAALEILKAGSSRVISFNMSQEDIERFMRQSWVMTSSDGNERHPRKYASFPKKFSEFVAGKGLMSTSAFVHRSSGLTADSFGIEHRGYLREGYFADIGILDEDNFAPQADYFHWDRLSTGVVHLMVNGQLVIKDGEPQTVLPGRTLLKAPE